MADHKANASQTQAISVDARVIHAADNPLAWLVRRHLGLALPSDAAESDHPLTRAIVRELRRREAIERGNQG